MPHTPDSLKAGLAAGAKLGANAAASAAEIHKAAEARLDVVCQRIGDLRSKAIMDAAAETKYTALVEERGRLNLVLGR